MEGGQEKVRKVQMSGSIQVTALSQIDYGVKGNHFLELNSRISGSSPIYIPPAFYMTGELVLRGDNRNFTGGWHIMGKVKVANRFGLGKCPVVVDGGRVEVATQAELGDFEVANRAQVRLYYPTTFESLKVAGVYEADDLVLEWTKIQAGSTFTVKYSEPQTDFNGPFSPRSHRSPIQRPGESFALPAPERAGEGYWFDSKTWSENFTPSEAGGWLNYRVPAGVSVKGTPVAHGIDRIEADCFEIEKGARFDLDSVFGTIVFPELVLSGGTVTDLATRDFFTQTVIGGNIRVEEESVFNFESKHVRGVRKKYYWRGTIEGDESIVLELGKYRDLEIGADTSRYTGDWIVRKGSVRVARDNVFEHSTVTIDNGLLILEYRLEPRVKLLHLNNNSRIEMWANLIEVETLFVDGERIPDGIYSDAEWINNIHGRAAVHVGNTIVKSNSRSE